MTTPFTDAPVPQIVPGAPYAQKNCVPATCGCNIGRSTVGRLRRSGAQVRAASAAAHLDRGLSYGEAVDAVEVTTSNTVKPLARYGLENADLRALADAGHSGAISIDTAVTHYTSRKTANYVGNHTVGWYDYRWVTDAANCRCELQGTTSATVDHGEFLVEDPGTTIAGYLWWSAGLLYRAAQARTGGNGINVIVFPDTEGVTRTVIVSGAAVRPKPSLSSPGFKYLGKGTYVRVVKTQNAGAWKRSDGSTANGWHEVHLADGRYGWVRGGALR